MHVFQDFIDLREDVSAASLLPNAGLSGKD